MRHAKPMTAKQMKAALLKNVTEYNRSIFGAPLTDALYHAPRAKDLKKLRENPEAWGRHVRNMAGLNGFAERTEHVTKHYDMAQLAETLLARHGADKLLTIWQSMNLPLSQLPESARQVIEHDAEST